MNVDYNRRGLKGGRVRREEVIPLLTSASFASSVFNLFYISVQAKGIGSNRFNCFSISFTSRLRDKVIDQLSLQLPVQALPARLLSRASSPRPRISLPHRIQPG